MSGMVIKRRPDKRLAKLIWLPGGRTVDSIRRGVSNAEGSFAAVIQTEETPGVYLQRKNEPFEPIIEFLDKAWNDYFLGGIWLSALGLAALADRGEQTRLLGGDVEPDRALGRVFLERTIETARRGRPRGGRCPGPCRGWRRRRPTGGLPAGR